MNLPRVITEQCNFCSKHRPGFRLHRISQAQLICDHCLEWHHHALEFLGGKMPPGCQECGKTFDELRVFAEGVEYQVRMYVLPKDGIYQLLCGECVKPYTQKRGDLYRGTQFGHEVLKIA